MEWIGILFTDDDIPEELLDEVREKTEDLRQEAVAKLDEYLESRGLESIQGLLRHKPVYPK